MSSAEAQAAATQVPPALATALLAVRNMGLVANVQYFVGATPPGWESTGLPPLDLPVLGSMSADGIMVTVFMDPTRRFVSLYRERLDSAGWTQPSYSQERGGFAELPSPSGTRVRFIGSTMCHGSSSAAVTPGGGQSVSGSIVVAVRTYERSCDPAERIRNLSKGLAIPLLVPPPLSVWRANSAENGEDHVASSAQFQDATTPAPALLAHFASQLVAAGWTPAESAERERFAARMFDARDSEGHEWTGALTVTAAGKVRVVSLTMTRTNPNVLR